MFATFGSRVGTLWYMLARLSLYIWSRERCICQQLACHTCCNVLNVSRQLQGMGVA